MAMLDAQVDANLGPFRTAVELLMSIPGIKNLGAHVIVSEIGIDMSRFPSAAHLISWACPRDEPTNAPQLFRRRVRSAYSFRHARLCFKTKQSDRRPRFNVPECPIPRDFVPWRFSDAGRNSAWIVSACRRLKNCTAPDSCTAPKGRETLHLMVKRAERRLGELMEAGRKAGKLAKGTRGQLTTAGPGRGKRGKLAGCRKTRQFPANNRCSNKASTRTSPIAPARLRRFRKRNSRLRSSVLEDKIVQQAVASVLEAIYEEDFLGFSYGASSDSALMR
jgi:hypothetical protein